jgi:hypothetical protein
VKEYGPVQDSALSGAKLLVKTATFDLDALDPAPLPVKFQDETDTVSAVITEPCEMFIPSGNT